MAAQVELSPQERQYFRKMFDLYDTDKSGAIGFSELKNLARYLGVELTEENLLASVRSIGINASSKDQVDLSFEQFIRWLRTANSAGDEFAMLKAKITAAGNKALNNEQIARLKEVFDHFDADGSGSIDSDELGEVFISMGEEVTKVELEQMIAGVDDDGSGQIEFPEFMMLMCGNFGGESFEQEMHNKFLTSDANSSGTISVQELRDLIVQTAGGLIEGEELENILKTAVEECPSGISGQIDYMKWESLWEACREES